MGLVIRPGTPDDVSVVEVIANEAKDTINFLGGWTPKPQILERYTKGNQDIPYNVVAELDGEVVGFSDSKPRSQHYVEYEHIAVDPRYRKMDIGSSLLLYHTLRSALQGRYFARLQTMGFNSRMSDHFLPANGFTESVRQRTKFRSFTDLVWWIKWITPDTLQSDIERIAQSSDHEYVFDLDYTKSLETNFSLVEEMLLREGDLERLDIIRETREMVRSSLS